MNAAPGGAERDFSKPASVPNQSSTLDSNDLSISASATEPKKKKHPKLGPNEARIERDADGNVVRIVYGSAVGDGSNSSSETDDEEEEEFEGFGEDNSGDTSVVKQLEEMARNVIPSAPRVQSDREQDWIADLVNKHGDDYEAMKWDKKLNVFQQSAGDLKKRVVKWKKNQRD